MLNLLRAGFFRYLRSTVFKVCTLLAAVFAALFSYSAMKTSNLNEIWFMFGTLMIAVLITFTVGGETSSCIRNKLAAGYTKTQIYFSEIILANVFALIYYAVFFVFFLVGNFYITEHTPAVLSLQASLGFAAMAVLLASAFASISCMISSKTAPAVVSLILVIVLTITNSIAADALKEKEFFKVGSNQSGKWEYWEEKNPEYVDEPLRSVLTFYRDTNPYGQRAEYEGILVPFLYDDEAWERAKEATADTIGNDFLMRDISEDEQKYLNRTPLVTLTPVPAFILAGWFVFKKKEFK
ncbi:MAG: hypothetical protein IJW21_05565 [Clostridia bacterium]|nr:hypothetical protein [Clostridia bacterium]